MKIEFIYKEIPDEATNIKLRNILKLCYEALSKQTHVSKGELNERISSREVRSNTK